MSSFRRIAVRREALNDLRRLLVEVERNRGAFHVAVVSSPRQRFVADEAELQQRPVHGVHVVVKCCVAAVTTVTWRALNQARRKEDRSD